MANTTKSTAPDRTQPGQQYGQQTPYPKVQKPAPIPANRPNGKGIGVASHGQHVANPPVVKRGTNKSTSNVTTLANKRSSR